MKFLGYKCKRNEVEDMIWEVDEDCDKCVNWEEFKSMYASPGQESHAKARFFPAPYLCHMCARGCEVDCAIECELLGGAGSTV